MVGLWRAYLGKSYFMS